MTFLKYTSGFINLIDRRKADGNINIEAIFVEPKDYLALWGMYMGLDTYCTREHILRSSLNPVSALHVTLKDWPEAN
jgi:hypothetical protein